MKFNLLFFIRLLLRHVGLLIAAPIILAVLVAHLTKDEAKVYNSKARIYTGIASGSSIELANTKVDFRATNTAYDNLINIIKSRETLEDTSLRLFTQHMLLDSANEKYISKLKYQELMMEVPEEVKKLVVKNNFEKTLNNFINYKESSHYNYIYELINLKHPDYGIDQILGKIKVRRIMSSDFVDIEYESEDAGICQNTLYILTEVFVRLNAHIKVNQSDAVVGYFDVQLKDASKNLKVAEEELLKFNEENKIINYYEQTKHIASQKEHFELEFQKVQRNLFASRAVLNDLEKRLGTHEKKKLSSDRIMEIRNKMSKLNFDISIKTLGLEKDSVQKIEDEKDVGKMLTEVAALKTELEAQIDTIFNVDHETNGLASSNVLDEWLVNTITYESTKAQVEVMNQTRIEFEALYKLFAPLGATMKRLERKIDIAEREYLSLLNNLGLAKLRQQNVELTSILKLTEPPFYPINPKASKRKILIVVAGLMGFIIVTFTLLILEFLDGNLNTAARALDVIGLEVSSIFPTINKKNKKIDFDYIQNKAVNAISRVIILNQFKREKQKRPLANMLFSTQEGEGKSFVCEHLIAKLCELDYKTLHITYDLQDIGVENENYKKLIYPISDQLYTIESIEEFDAENEIEDFKFYDFAIIEIPAIIRNPFPVNLASIMDQIFMVTRANRAWGDSDKNALSLFENSITGPKPSIILNGVKVLEMETVIGEIPKRRSWFRKFVKRMVQFRFFTKNKVK